MKSIGILAAAMRDWHGEARKPKMARALLFPAPVFCDDMVCRIVREMVLNGGDWRAALKEVRRRAGQAGDKARLAAFEKWALRVTARPVRGLLTAGGAS